MKKIALFLLFFSSVCSIMAQEVAIAASDSVFWADRELEPGLISISDSIIEDAIPCNPGVIVDGALMRSWLRNYPWHETSYEVQRRLAEEMEIEGCPEVDSLSAIVEAIPFDVSLTIAQSDLRMPVRYDADNYDYRKPTLYDQLIANSNKSADAYEDRFSKQLAYGNFRKNAVDQYASQHLNQVKHLKDEEVDMSIFERKSLDRKEFEATDLVISDAALDLETAILDIEQVTFHADKWHRKGSTSVQIAQTALSSNWYKGGDNNMTMSTYDKLVFSRYDESMKTTLDITFELRLSGYYTAADTINPMRVNDNQFRVDVSYGYKAWKNWYYSTSFYAKTPIFDFHTANSKVTKSTFFSPLETNLGVGFDYKRQSKDKRINFNLMLAPLSYSITSVASDRVNVTQYSIEEGKKSFRQFGSSVTCKLDWKITDMISWNTRLYYFTTYKAVQLEFENNVNVQLGKYCSAKFYYYPRLDDKRDDRFECKQMLTFGLSLVW